MNRHTDGVENGRIILHEDGRKILLISSAGDMMVIASPRRQQILKMLKASNRPLHGKEIADRLGIKAPSVHFHLNKLEQLGAVRLSHTRIINGITARFYEAAVDDIIAGEEFAQQAGDEDTQRKLLLMGHLFDEAKASFTQALGKKMRAGKAEESANRLTVAASQVLYLCDEDSQSLYREMEAVLDKYLQYSSGKQPYSLFMSIFPADTVE